MQRQITALLTLAWATAALADLSPITSQATTSLLGQTNTVITTAPKPNAPMTLSGANPTARARWQQSLVLGPGDILDITMFGSIDLNRDGIVVGPDGKITYLEVQDLPVSGLTVDQTRTQAGFGSQPVPPLSKSVRHPPAMEQQEVRHYGESHAKWDVYLEQTHDHTGRRCAGARLAERRVSIPGR